MNYFIHIATCNRLTGIIVLSLLLFACQKYRLNRDTTTANEHTKAENLYHNCFKTIKSGLRANPTVNTPPSSLDTCAQIKTTKVDTQEGTTIEFQIDFGKNYCSIHEDIRQKGKIQISYKKQSDQQKITATFNNFYINDYQVKGTLTAQETGDTPNKLTQFNLQIKNGIILPPRGKQFQWETSRTYTQSKGINSSNKLCDNVWKITSKSSGVNSKGRSFKSSTIDTIMSKACCPWYVEGIVELTPDGLQNRQIDYGDGTCDNKAKVYIKNRTYNIQF